MNHPICPQCQSPIPPDAPGGLCPSCVLLGAMGSAAAAGKTTALGSVPPMAEMRAAFPELEVIEMIGQGGMGVVFKARQTRLDRLVALKILPPLLATQVGFAERFLREARALARLSHPHIVGVHDFGERAGFYYLMMEYVDGVNLRQAIRAGIKPAQALTLVPKICEALQFAHDRGVLHRDIKPENILLDVSGAPKLADFGIAKLAGEPGTGLDLTLTGASLGTAAYMAPEQVERPAEVDHRADIYSLGVVLYEMLTGELPLGRFAAPSEKSTVTRGVDEVVLRALEKERERRQQSATEMKTEVEHASASGLAGSMHEAGDDERDEDRGPGFMVNLFWLLMVLCAVSMPLTAVSGLRQYISPATQAVSIGVFGALYALWPWRRRRSRRRRKHFQANEAPRHWEIRCTTCGQVRPLEEVGGLRLGAHSIGKRTIGYCSQCGVMRAMAIAPMKTSATGVRASTGSHHEARSRRTLFGLPLYHIVRGPDPVTGEVPVAVGVLAIGPVAKGLLAIGGRTFGGIAIGGVATGVLALGGVTFGFISIGGVAIALLAALGGCAIAPLAFGGLAVGLSAVGGMAVGKEAYGGHTIREALPLGAASYALRQAAVISVIGIGVMALLVLLLAAFARGPVGVEEKPGPLWARRIFWLLFALLGLPIIGGVVALVLPRFIASRESSPLSTYQKMPPIDVVTPGQHPAVARWPHGTVELVGVTRHPSGMGDWWAMDGSPAKEGPFAPAGQRVEERPGETAYEFVFHVRDLPAGASTPKWQVQHYTRSTGGDIPALVKEPEKPLPGYLTIAAAMPDSVTAANIKIGVAIEPWTTVSASHPRGSIGNTRRMEGIEWNVTHGAAVETKEGFSTTFQYRDQPGWDQRVAAFNGEGKEVGRGRLSKLNDLATYYFEGVALRDVAELRYQVRPIRWVEFQGIALAPAEVSPARARLELEDEMIRAARTQWERMKQRSEAGLATLLDLKAAERDLAVAEARGNEKKMAEAKVNYAEYAVAMARHRKEAGLMSSEEFGETEKQYFEARMALENASRKEEELEKR